MNISELPGTVGEALSAAKRVLSESAFLRDRGLVATESEELVSASFRKACGRRLGRVDLYSGLGEIFPKEAGQILLTMSRGRVDGTPLQYLTGEQAFLNHIYEVGPHVLVPRPETEFLVVLAQQELEKSPSLHLGIEVGVGSGAISVELLDHFPGLKIVGSELSSRARECALSNARRILHSGDRLEVRLVNDSRLVLEPFQDSRADFIISNPPYLVRSDEIDSDVLSHEPPSALFAPESDPLHFYRQIAENAEAILNPRGWVFIEIPCERSGEIFALFNERWDARLLKDLTDRDRIILARRKSLENG